MMTFFYLRNCNWISKKRMRRLGVVLLFASATAVHAVDISGIDDFDLGTWNPYKSLWEVRVPVCVWDDDGLTHFRVRVSGNTGSTGFWLQNDIGEKLKYQVFWHDKSDSTSIENLVQHQESSEIYSFAENEQCSYGPNAMIRVSIDRLGLERATPAVYEDSLVVMIVPQ